MFVDFDAVFHPTEEQKRRHAELVNEMLRENLKNNGECCSNCMYIHDEHIGLDITLPYCLKKKKYINDDMRCVYYEFCGFMKMP